MEHFSYFYSNEKETYLMSANKFSDKMISEKFWGSEPIYREVVSTKNDINFSKLLNWYNQMSDTKDHDKWIVEYMKKNGYSKQDISGIVNLDSSANVTKSSAAVLARMETNGTIFDGEMKDLVKNKIHKALEFKQKIIAEETTTAKVVSIQDRIKALAEQHIIYVDDEIFNWYHERKTKISFSLYTYLQSNQLNSQICNHIKNFIAKIRDEHAEMMEGKDEQLNEGYAYLSNASKKEIMKQLNQCVEDIERHVGNTKASKERKPRKKKEVSASKLINKLNYQKEFVKLKIKSIVPESIIGSQQLWLYNTKYDQLTMLNAISSLGLTVKGSTITGYDPDASVKKKVRKPEQTIQKVLSGGKQILTKLMSTLTTKPIEVNGRVNNDTIILRAIK